MSTTLQKKSIPSATFTSFMLKIKEDPIDPYYDSSPWFNCLASKFPRADITICGYNFTGHSGIHFVRLRNPKSADEETFKQQDEHIAAILSGDVSLPDCLHIDADLSQSRKIRHPDEMFAKYTNMQEQVDIKQVYGSSSILNQYLTTLATQKRLQGMFTAKPLWYAFIYHGDVNTARQKTQEFEKSFAGLRMAKVLTCEAYTSIDCDSDSRTHVILELEPVDPKYPEKVKCSLYDVITKRLPDYKLEYDAEMSADDLDKHWMTCKRIICHTDTNSTYREFTAYCQPVNVTYTQHPYQVPATEIHTIATTTEDQVDAEIAANLAAMNEVETTMDIDDLSESDTDELDDSDTSIEPDDTVELPSTASAHSTPQKTNSRHYFSFAILTYVDIIKLIDLRNALLEASSYIVQINAYYKESNDLQYLSILVNPKSKGIDRRWFTQADMMGSKVLAKANFNVKQLPYTDELQFFTDINPNCLLDGDRTSMFAYREQKASKAPSTLTKDEVIKLFRDKIESKVYRCIADMRKEFKGDHNVLSIISRENAVLRDMVGDFAPEAYLNLPIKTPVQSLVEYVQKNPLQSDESPLTDDFLRATYTYEPLDAIYKVLVVAATPKQGTIILYGAPNSGKSSIIKIMHKIFICDKLNITLNTFDKVPVMKDYKYQLITQEEADMNKMFKDSHLHFTKILMERGGKQLEVKRRDPMDFYQGAVCLFATNDFCLQKLSKNSRDAIETRSIIVEMQVKQELSSKYPLTAQLVADWLLSRYLKEHPECVAQPSTPSSQVQVLGKRKRDTKTQIKKEKAYKRIERNNE